MEISVITPVYGCKDCIYEFYHRVCSSVEPITPAFEIIYVNDHSPDKPGDLLQELAKKDTRVKILELSRNFGQHNAITAGLSHATGEWVVVADCDLQDRPEEIPRLFQKTREGYDVVLAQRKTRQDKWTKRLFSKVFYKTLGYLTNTTQDHSVANFGIYHQRVVKAILSMKDSIRYFPAMVQWVGFNSATLEVEHSGRYSGRTSYGIKRMLALGTSVVLSFSEKPLMLVVRFGLAISLLSFIAGLIFLARYFLGLISVLGFTSLLLSIWFLSGVIIVILGIVGMYLGKTFDRVKDRPLYIVKNKINL